LPAYTRLRLFWVAVKAAWGKASNDKLREQFMTQARRSGLVAAVHATSRHGEEDVRHVLNWGLLGMDPFGNGGR
jgi:hypothetical protein